MRIGVGKHFAFLIGETVKSVDLKELQEQNLKQTKNRALSPCFSSINQEAPNSRGFDETACDLDNQI